MANTHIPESPIWCPKMVEYRWVTLREYPPNGFSGSKVSVIATEMLTGPESSRACGDWVDTLACPLVIVLSGVVVSLVRCFNVSFSDTHKSKSLNRKRKVFQSFRKNETEKQVWAVWKCYHCNYIAMTLKVTSHHNGDTTLQSQSFRTTVTVQPSASCIGIIIWFSSHSYINNLKYKLFISMILNKL